jgi:methylphosphotriester-DNA--protein-cysteine methyltransferase
MTPMDYYKRTKIDKIKEKLLAPGLSISEAFAVCGVEYNGRYKQYFKDIVGKTPSKYREENTNK